jgi:hypothetical protein
MKGRSWIVAAAIAGLLLAGPAAAGDVPGGFTFTPPPGWIDISRGAPEAQRRLAPPALLAQADDPAMAFFAIAPDRYNDGSVDYMRAVVRPDVLPPVVTAATLTELAAGIEDEFSRQGLAYRALKQDLIKVAGVNGGSRLVGELQTPNGVMTLIQYSIPGDRSHAALTFRTTPERFARDESIFEASAQATRGAVEPRPQAPWWKNMAGDFIAGAAGGGLAILFARFVYRRRRARAGAASPPGSAPSG